MMNNASTPSESLEAHDRRSSTLRRVVMPLLVVLVAGAIYFWGQQSRERDLRDVEDAVRILTHEMFHSPLDGPLPDRARQMGMSISMAERMQQVLANHEWNAVRVIVYTGDTPPPFGDGRATHHAILFINHQSELGLRLAHRGDPDQIEMLGYWIPAAAGAP